MSDDEQDKRDFWWHLRLIGLAVFVMLCGAVVSEARAQELEVTVTLDKTTSSWGFELNVLNSSPSESVTTVLIELDGGATFDHETSDGFTGTPELGGNNDGLRSALMTWDKPLATNELMRVTGDIDGSSWAGTATATINFASGIARTFDLVQNIDTWTGILSETDRPPGLIINGEATATLTWRAPTENEDGTTLDPADIAGFVLYWGITSDNCGDRPATLLDACYGNALDLLDGALVTTSLTLSLSGDTTVYFVGIAYTRDADGAPVLSAYSNEIQRVFVVSITEPTPAPSAPVLIDIVMTVTCTTNKASVTCEFSVE